MTARPLVLLADDDDDIRETVSMLLADEGFDVVAVGDGSQAQAALEAGTCQPNCIILDLMMPVMDGWEFWSWIQQSRFANIPVVMWSASNVDARSLGSARLVKKSSHPDELLKAVRRSL